MSEVSSNYPVLQLASGLDQPDDLTFNSGAVLVGEFASGQIVRLDGPGGPQLALPARVPEVEGLAYLDGTLYAANQAQDVVDQVDGASVTTFARLAPVAGVEGVDGIGVDVGQLVVPDSPHGDILFLTPAGQVSRELGGFDRPTGVWAGPGGSLLVADENAGTVVSVAPSGSRQVLASGIVEPDDVAQTSAGSVYTISITSGALLKVASGSTQTVASGLRSPQGLTLDGAGNPIVTESGAGRVDLVVTTFALPPGPVLPVALGRGQPMCVDLERGPGFTSAVMLSAGAGARVLRQAGKGDLSEVVPPTCELAQCSLHLEAKAGPLLGQSWISYRVT